MLNGLYSSSAFLSSRKLKALKHDQCPHLSLYTKLTQTWHFDMFTLQGDFPNHKRHTGPPPDSTSPSSICIFKI